MEILYPVPYICDIHNKTTANLSLIKSISGIRGTIGGKVGDNLTPLDIVESTAAFAKWLHDKGCNKKVVIGRDGRISGHMVENLVINTLLASGIDVVNLDYSTTPTVEIMVQKERAGAGIIITASHNPKEWNALKFLNHEGEFISAEDGAMLLHIIQDRSYKFVEVEHLGQLTYINNAIDQHIESVLNYPLVNVDAIRSKKYHIVVDCINSTGALALPPLLDKLGCSYTLLNSEINGDFAHNPEPLPENLVALSAKVKESGAIMGIAIDPDVDRLALIKSNGEMFGEENTLVLIADYILREKGPGATVSNLSSSRALKDITEKHGGTYYAAAVGEVNVVKKMKDVKAIIGGEGNGGIIVPDYHYGRDALIGTALTLSYLAVYDLDLMKLSSTYPSYTIIKDKIPLSQNLDTDDLFETLATKFPEASINRTDGIKFDLEEGWVHFRKSNTEPIMRIYCEGLDKVSAENLAARFKHQIDEIITKQK